MDPDVVLRQLREAADWATDQDPVELSRQAEMLGVMGALFIALDAWLSKGGFPPAAWHREHILTFGVSNTATCTCGRSFHGVLAEDLDREVDAHLREANRGGDRGTL